MRVWLFSKKEDPHVRGLQSANFESEALFYIRDISIVCETSLGGCFLVADRIKFRARPVAGEDLTGQPYPYSAPACCREVRRARNLACQCDTANSNYQFGVLGSYITSSATWSSSMTF